MLSTIDTLQHAERMLVLALDLLGALAFALSGAMAGVRRRLDLFGVLVLSFAAASSGGIMRDLLIGAVPPAAIDDPRYLAVSLLAGGAAFYGAQVIDRLKRAVLVFDGAGLAFFAVAGTEKALWYGLDPVMAMLCGVLTGIGGGIVRDVLLSEIPIVLRRELYATAALAGSAVVVAGDFLHVPPGATSLVGVILCFVLRMLAVYRGWHLPLPRGGEPHAPEASEKDRDKDR